MTKNENMNVKAPWIDHLDGIPAHLDYFQGSMYDKIAEVSENYPDYIAYDFMGGKVKYKDFISKVDKCARALAGIGVKPGESVTICMPNAPQAVIMFYAVNKIGAIANMVHPLSSEKEIEFCLKESSSVVCLTLDQFYGKFENIRENVHLRNLILTSVKDVLSPIKRKGYYLVEGRKIKKIPANAEIIWWEKFLLDGKKYHGPFHVVRKAEDPAVILYSGGTTGTQKGILLSNLNFNALAQQIVATNPMYRPGDKMLAVMPIFHGFGLGVCIHSMLANGGRCLLIPRFNPESYAKLLKKHRPNFIAGVPTLYEALLRIKSLDRVDLSCLKGVFSGGDSLSIELKKRFDKFLKDHNASIPVREGYGTTECVTASCLTPVNRYKEGSIGLPFPDTFYKIVKPGTEEEVPYGEEGEICLSGPTVMIEYINNPEETANTLRRHKDGLKWIHTGDLGMMDEEGFVYFRQRIKRMIITSGYNVYPSRIENILDAHELVHMSCVIGVPDPYKMQKVVAFVVLRPEARVSNEEATQILMEYLKKHVAKYALPASIEFRESLPKTLVGKVAYRILEEEELKKYA
ncbi:MAG TPA: AMP-binding protein [Candidatus Fimisoma avicola]|uniref:AMP-binding protein n=1 Tax=Candidatus Fimisoma avicola TaxID=2840826 RepID=A0A9D1L9D5_9FIRM|nr:AMP-binding protein [Candidatus Fimisoma avicola]